MLIIVYLLELALLEGVFSWSVGLPLLVHITFKTVSSKQKLLLKESVQWGKNKQSSFKTSEYCFQRGTFQTVSTSG